MQRPTETPKALGALGQLQFQGDSMAPKPTFWFRCAIILAVSSNCPESQRQPMAVPTIKTVLVPSFRP